MRFYVEQFIEIDSLTGLNLLYFDNGAGYGAHSIVPTFIAVFDWQLFERFGSEIHQFGLAN